MSTFTEYEFHPKDVADKTLKANLSKAIKMSLDIESKAVRHNTQNFNSKRYIAVGKLDDYEELKNKARLIKEKSIEDLPNLINQLTSVIEKRGGKVILAKTKEEATDYIKNVCLRHSAKLVVKAKSITTEEIHLNQILEKEWIEVAETDLAEFILQVSKEQPSHNVAPAIHRSRERITKLFKENFVTDKPLETGEQLTEFARDILRQKFLNADIGISGANLIAAEEGTILLVESEGNIRLTTQLPAVHIAVAGIEKIIPSKKDFGTFIELLAASATGQSLSSYTNILEPPIDLPMLNLNNRNDNEREFHLVLIDNGRMKMRGDSDLKEALYCLRCSACMNVCANFQAVGGHAFGGECYTGGIGGAWTLGTSSLQKARFAELCTGCSRCIPNCPVRIDIPKLNTIIKKRLMDAGESSFQKIFFGNFSSLAKFASILPGISNWVAGLKISKSIFQNVIGFDERRSVPKFATKTLASLYYKNNNVVKNQNEFTTKKILLFCDVYTNYNNPNVGVAAVEVFKKLGIPIQIGNVMEDGRSAQSQGLIDSAANSALKVSTYLEKYIDHGYEIIFTEPSVLAMIKQDYKKLINNDSLDKKLKDHCYDPIELMNILLEKNELDLQILKEKIRIKEKKLFYHGHCQMKSIGLGSEIPKFFQQLGFEVDCSTVECCGMAGSFGYKKQYYDLSVNVGKDLMAQIIRTQPPDHSRQLLASGTSCREQIKDLLNEEALHPIEFMNKIIRN
jgi:iron-sulfur cluster protein